MVTLMGGLLAAPLAAEAQQPGKVYRVGVLFSGSRQSSMALIRAFGEGLREHSYAEGRNLSIEHRFAESRAERVPRLAAELAKLNVDVIVTSVDRWAIAVRQAAANIPIVMTTAEDPVGAGLVKSLAHPGGNVTGVAIVAGPEIYGKNLELLKEILPKGASIAILFNPDSAINARYLRAIQEAARALDVTLIPTGVRRVEDFEPAFVRMKREQTAGVVILGEPLFGSNRRRLADLALRSGLASSGPHRDYVDTGGLVSYGANQPDLWRRAATYVDKILKGAKPGDLPVEQPTKFELVFNMKTAKALGLTIPQSVLLRADELIQ
jgi:putative tryptophan/tyrosine transport system substrate-binding protein